MSDVKEKILNLLKTYPAQKRLINALRYELKHPAQVSHQEVIDNMTLNGEHQIGGWKKHASIPNRTMHTALEHKKKAHEINEEIVSQIANELSIAEAEVEKLEYYISLLKEEHANVLRHYYFEEKTWPMIVDELYSSRKTLQNYRDQALQALVTMYETIEQLKTRY